MARTLPDAELADFARYAAARPDGDPLRLRAAWRDTRNKRNAAARAKGEPDPFPPLADDRRLAWRTMGEQADRNLGMLAVKPPADEGEMERRFALLEAADALVQTPTQETAEFVAPDALPVGIAFMSDLHVGAGGVDYTQLRADIASVQDATGLYVVVNGDVLENTKPQAKSGTALYHGLFNDPQEQIAYATLRLRLMRGKILALTQGNHDSFDGRWAGVDRLPALAADLACPYFSERGGTIVCQVGTERYHVVAKHQYVGQSRINTSNSARRLWDEYPEFDNADVIALAHLHYPDLQQVPRKGRIVTYLRSGTYKTHDAWAEARGYKPMYGIPVIILLPDTHKVVAIADFGVAVQTLAMLRRAYQK